MVHLEQGGGWGEEANAVLFFFQKGNWGKIAKYLVLKGSKKFPVPVVSEKDSIYLFWAFYRSLLAKFSKNTKNI